MFDTNSLISAAILPDSISGKAFILALDTGFIVLSKDTFKELELALNRRKFNKYLPNLSDRSVFIQSLSASSLRIEPNISITACRDPKDNKFLELAVTAKASCIVTGDKDLLALHPFREIPILTVKQFLESF